MPRRMPKKNGPRMRGEHAHTHPWEHGDGRSRDIEIDRARLGLGMGPPARILSRGDFSPAEVAELVRLYGGGAR